MSDSSALRARIIIIAPGLRPFYPEQYCEPGRPLGILRVAFFILAARLQRRDALKISEAVGCERHQRHGPSASRCSK